MDTKKVLYFVTDLNIISKRIELKIENIFGLRPRRIINGEDNGIVTCLQRGDIHR